MEDSSTPSGGTPTALSNNNVNGNANGWGPMQKIKRAKARQQKYSPYECSAKWVMNPKIMNPKDDFQVVRHRSGRTKNIASLIDNKQEQNNSSMINGKHQSMYIILNNNDDEEMDDVNDKGTINIANGDANIGEKKNKP